MLRRQGSGGSCWCNLNIRNIKSTTASSFSDAGCREVKTGRMSSRGSCLVIIHTFKCVHRGFSFSLNLWGEFGQLLLFLIGSFQHETLFSICSFKGNSVSYTIGLTITFLIWILFFDHGAGHGIYNLNDWLLVTWQLLSWRDHSSILHWARCLYSDLLTRIHGGLGKHWQPI